MIPSKRMSRDTQPIKILVVEDNPADARLISEGFAECGHKCDLHRVSTLEQAKNTLEGERFHMLISDMGVPHEATVEFLQWARSHTEGKMPIIVLSGYPDPNPSYQAGANAFISKPGDVHEFFRRVRTLMHFWINVATLPRAQTHK